MEPVAVGDDPTDVAMSRFGALGAPDDDPESLGEVPTVDSGAAPVGDSEADPAVSEDEDGDDDDEDEADDPSLDDEPPDPPSSA